MKLRSDYCLYIYSVAFLSIMSIAGCVTPEGPKTGLLFKPNLSAYADQFPSSKEIKIVGSEEESKLSLENGYIKIGAMTIRHDKEICWDNEKCREVKQTKSLKDDLLSSAKMKGANTVVLAPISKDSRAISKAGKCIRSKQVKKYNVICTGGQSTYGSSTMGSSGVFRKCVNQPYYTSECIERDTKGGAAYSQNLSGTLYRYDPKMAALEANNDLYVEAIRTGNLTNIKSYISMGLPSDATLLDGTLPISVASSSGQIESVKILLKNGANPSSIDSTGKSPIMYALLSKNPEMVELLVRNNCEVIQCDSEGKTVLEYSMNSGEQFIEVIMSSKNVIFKGSGNTSGEGEIQAALLNRNPEIAQKLIAKGAKIPELDISLVQDVIVKSDLKTAKFLVSIKPPCLEPRTFGKLNKEIQNMYARLIRKGDKDVIDFILSMQIPYDRVTEFSPLMLAAKKGDIDTINKLIADGININKVDWMENTALMFASKAGHLDVVKTLFESGADVNMHGWSRLSTALSDSMALSNYHVTEYLLSKGADPNMGLSSWEPRSRYPIILASEKCNVKITKLLIENGADVNRGAYGRNIGRPLYRAKFWRKVHLKSNDIETVKKCDQVIDLLLTAGAKE